MACGSSGCRINCTKSLPPTYAVVLCGIATSLLPGTGTAAVHWQKAREVLWMRLVVTIGEKIGKSHLTYVQGASAEIVSLVAMAGSVQH